MLLERTFPDRPFHRPAPAPMLDEDFDADDLDAAEDDQ